MLTFKSAIRSNPIADFFIPDSFRLNFTALASHGKKYSVGNVIGWF